MRWCGRYRTAQADLSAHTGKFAMPMSSYFSEASTTLHTVRDCRRFAVSRFNQAELFFGHGSSDAYDEAAYLILHTLHLPPDRLHPLLHAALADGVRRAG